MTSGPRLGNLWIGNKEVAPVNFGEVLRIPQRFQKALGSVTPSQWHKNCLDETFLSLCSHKFLGLHQCIVEVLPTETYQGLHTSQTTPLLKK